MIAYATPFVTSDPVLVARTVDELANKFPAYKEAWQKYNQVYLTNLAVFDTYQLFGRNPINSLDDLKGQKVAAAGLNLRYLEGLGAAGVAGSLVGYYNKLKTGVVDSAMIWAEAAVAFKLAEVAPHMLKADIGTANSKAITMNADSWARLPAEVQTAIAEAAIAYRDHMGRLALEIADGSYKKYQAAGGTIVEMPVADRENWAKTMPNVAKDWAADLEAKGLPGNDVLRAYMEAMRDANQPIMRQWDKELGS